MYKILVRNNETGIECWNYGFSRWMAKRIYFLMNEKIGGTCEDNYEVILFLKLGFTLDTFKKCLLNKTEVL